MNVARHVTVRTSTTENDDRPRFDHSSDNSSKDARVSHDKFVGGTCLSWVVGRHNCR